MRSARPRRGAISTAPESVTISRIHVALLAGSARAVRIGGGDALALQARRSRRTARHPGPRATAGSARNPACGPSETAPSARARPAPGAFSSSTFRPTSPRSHTSSCTRSGMSSSRTNSTSSGMFSPKPISWSLPRESFSPQRREQIQRRIGQPSGLLHGQFQARSYPWRAASTRRADSSRRAWLQRRTAVNSRHCRRPESAPRGRWS